MMPVCNIPWSHIVKVLKMNRVARTWVVSFCMVAAGYAGAQSFPNKTLRIIVPAGPGSAVDVVARDLTPGLSEALGQQVIVENRPGVTAALAPVKSRERLPMGTPCCTATSTTH